MRLTYLCKGEIDSDLLVTDEVHGECSSESFGASEFSLWVVTFETKGNAESDAKWLSGVARRFDGAGVDCLVLEDEASAYYERRLYERFARFERKLRAALYLNIALREGKLDDQLIVDLETIDFGKLFGRFFVDEQFVASYRKLLGDKDGRFEKADLLAEIGGLEENAKWD